MRSPRYVRIDAKLSILGLSILSNLATRPNRYRKINRCRRMELSDKYVFINYNQDKQFTTKLRLNNRYAWKFIGKCQNEKATSNPSTHEHSQNSKGKKYE